MIMDPENVPDKMDALIVRARHLLGWAMSEYDAQRQLVAFHDATPEEAVNAIAAARVLCKYE